MDISERDYDLLVDAEIQVDVMLGNANLTIKEFLDLSEGDIVSLDKTAGSGGDIYVNSRIIGTGDIIVMEENLGLQSETPPLKSFFGYYSVGFSVR